jgi:pimeloyl-ACP methyl ester carboxylesterase
MTAADDAGRVSTATLTPAEIVKIVLGALGAMAVIDLAAEAVQTAAEYARLVSDPIYMGRGVPRGDGHRVLVIPGFLGSDGYLDTLRRWLARIGYEPVASGLRRNTGFNQQLLAALEDRVTSASYESGRPISIIGHSLGGIYARALARRHPEAVDRIVTMGSPLRVDAGPISPSIRFTAISSRKDRIVRYPRALAAEAGARNVEVSGCHCGMAFNPEVYRAVGEFLGADQDAKASATP